MYPENVAGLVDVDPTDPRSFEQPWLSSGSRGGSAGFSRRKASNGSVRPITGTGPAEMEVIQASDVVISPSFVPLPPLPWFQYPFFWRTASRPRCGPARRHVCPLVCRGAWMAQRIEASASSWRLLGPRILRSTLSETRPATRYRAISLRLRIGTPCARPSFGTQSAWAARLGQVPGGDRQAPLPLRRSHPAVPARRGRVSTRVGRSRFCAGYARGD